MAKTAQPIDLFKAVEQMRRISLAGGSFSFKFRKWNRATGRGGDLVIVNEARLRPKASDEKIANAGFKLFYIDLETGRAANCWQPLITEFNGMKTILN